MDQNDYNTDIAIETKTEIESLTPARPSDVSLDFKSSAVVQYSSVKFPAQFSTIQLNTDLNFPPSDQYCSGYFMFSDRHMHHDARKFSDYLSLNMADAYQDLVGQIDVISSSKNIKDLLKMPYSNSRHISIIVHRLGKTLLLEELDVHKNLIKKQNEEWSWLKNFYENVIAKEQGDKTKWLVSANSKRDSFTENIYLNLIRHSFAASFDDNECTALKLATDCTQVPHIPDSTDELKGFHHETLWRIEDLSMLIDSDLPIFGKGETPRPCISLRLRDDRSPPINVLTGLDYWLDNLMSNVPEVAMCYHVNGFVKKYEVLRTEDIPNLENSKFDPNEVLDIAQNIMSFIRRNAALEGHTYWLYKSENNEMVKLYDLTDYCKNEISEGDNPFTVPVGLLCHRVGSNLKKSGQRRLTDARAMFENCLRLLDESKHAQVCADAHFHLSDLWVPDKSIHDVWQEKGKISEPPSDLYDEDENSSDEISCKYSEVGSIAEQESVDNVKAIKSENQPEKKVDKEQINNSVALKELVVRGMVKRKAWEVIQACRIAGTTDERCRMALSHIRKGLNCVDKDQPKSKNIGLVEKQQTSSPSKAIPLFYKPLNLYKKDNSKNGADECETKEESSLQKDHPPVCDPSTAIPLNYTSLQSEKTDCGDAISNSLRHLSLKSIADSSTYKTYKDTEEDDQDEISKSWHVQAKLKLLRKAATTYFILAKEFFEIKKYGHTLRHLRYALHCYEAVELLNKGEKDEVQHKELYLMILYLAAQARCCVLSSWHQSRKDFDELGEEEAAILHSAQAILSSPKSSWVYEWPSSQESNMMAANELFDQAFKLPVFEKKSVNFKIEMKKNYAVCLLNLGNTQMEICKERITVNKEGYQTVKTVLDKSESNYLRAMKMFESENERNHAGHVCSNIAYLHVLAAAATTNSNPEHHFLPAEKEHLLKAIDWYEKGLSKYERGEAMDEAREVVYQNLRMQYQQMALRYFKVPTAKFNDAIFKIMKDFLQKSLSYCFLDQRLKYFKSSHFCAGLNHLNLARIFEVENFHCNNATRKRHLKQKMEENYQKSFDIYGLVKWRRSQMCVKFCWISSLSDECETDSLSIPAKKKLVQTVCSHLCDLVPVLIALGENDFDPDDKVEIYTTNFSAAKKLLTVLNGAFCSYFKMDNKNISLKKLYERSLRLTNMTTIEQLQPPLVIILQDLKTWLSSE